MFHRLIDTLDRSVPAQCAVCRAWPAEPVCSSCIARFAQPRPRCVRCALGVPAGVTTCGRCLREPPALDACFAAVDYEFPWSMLIAQFKFEGQPGWARAFATLMRSTPWVEPALDDADLVLPMPLSAQRLAERGFNQSLMLARLLAPDRAKAALLLRLRHTPVQTSLDRGAREANVRGAFAVDPIRAAELRGRRVVLVDDVMTSGASLYAAGRALKQAGAAHITGLVLARTEQSAA